MDERNYFCVLQIDLFVDGRAEPNKADSPEILDDWPMHNIKDIKVCNTQ